MSALGAEVRIAALTIAVIAASGGAWKLWHTADKAGYDRAQQEYKDAAEKQTAGNRKTSRGAEVKQAAQSEVREEFIVLTVKEILHETDNLASCVLTPAAVGLLNATKECAQSERAASCGPNDKVPSP